jgi:hypothetical protein
LFFLFKDAIDFMTSSGLDESSQQFLIRLFEQTNGDPSAQASMYDIGQSLGMDRNTSCRVAETLIGLQLVDIRTLSGGIGISSEGAEEVRGLIGGTTPAANFPGRLSDRPIMEPMGREAVQQVAEEIKMRAGSLGLDFNDLSALMADLKTIEAQLSSSRPKTAIIRECLRSLKEVLEATAENETLVKIGGLLGPEGG